MKREKLENLTTEHRKELEGISTQLKAISARLEEMRGCYKVHRVGVWDDLYVASIDAETAARRIDKMLPKKRPNGMTDEEWHYVERFRAEKATGVIDIGLWNDGNSYFQLIKKIKK